MLAFDQALARLLASAQPLGAERVPLDEAGGRVLAEDVVARAPLPPFDYSSMDGYALAARSLVPPGPWQLAVVGESAAGGDLPDLAPGTACRIFTGARLPRGADSVVMQERVERRGDVIALAAPPRPGDHVRRRGEDLAEGAVALAAGTRLSPGRVALAAALDRPQLLVARRPVVTVLCSGDELRSPGQAGAGRAASPSPTATSWPPPRAPWAPWCGWRPSSAATPRRRAARWPTRSAAATCWSPWAASASATAT